MSTLQHVAQPIHRTRLVLAVLIAGVAAALTIALIASSGSSAPTVSSVPPGKAQLTRQLESVNGARYGTARPTTSVTTTQTPQQQLDALAGERNRLRHITR
jgi:hypothetical protein